MKTNKLWVAALAMMMAASTSVGLVSCSDDDEPAPQPEIVTNPLDAEAYYITGIVTDGTAALADVAVSTSGVSATTGADGSYKLQVKSKGAYSVEFKKDGYIAVTASAQIASDAKTQSAVSLNQQLSAANKAVTVNPDEDQEIVEEKNTNISLAIPAGAVKEATDIAVTEYIAGEASTDMSSLSTINCTPDGLKFEKPIEFKIKNQMSGVQFADVKHYVEQNGTWKEEAPAAYDAENNAYVITMTGFSNHSAKVNSSMKKGSSATEAGSATTISNKGNLTGKKQNVSYQSKSGWEAGAISGAEGASAADQAALKAAIESLAASQMGTKAGVNTQTIDLGEANIDGDCDVTYTPEILTENRTISVPVIIGGKRVDVSMSIKVYVGVNVRKEVVYGEHHTDHSGGAMGR